MFETGDGGVSDFTNTAKELFCGGAYFKEHVMPDGFNWRQHKRNFPLFRRTRVQGIYDVR